MHNGTANISRPSLRRPLGILAVVVLLGFFLRFWGIWNADVSHDLAINSYRAVGWFDYLGDKQTSPVNWFGTLPWWTKLSFHDHPPLVFAIQHGVFWLLGQTSVTAHLPFILGGSLTIVVLYFLLARTRGPAAGLIAAGLYAVASYAVWESRSGYLEGVEQVFIVAAVYYLVALCTAGPVKPYYPLALGGALGAALLSKYTSVFLIPVIFIALFSWNRRLWRTRGFWYGVAAVVIALVPLAVYNVMIYLSRGHFDAALSSMLGLHPSDFGGIARRGVNLNFAENISSIVRILSGSLSWPFFWLTMIGLGASVVRMLQRRADRLTEIALLAMAGIVALFAFSGASDRFLSIIVPFLCVNNAVVWQEAWRKFPARGFHGALAGILVLVVGYEAFFSINTNVLLRPWGREGVTFSGGRLPSAGYEQLDAYLRAQQALPPLVRPKRITAYNQITVTVHFQGARLVLMDDRVDWFALMWYVRRYQHYYGANILDLTSFFELWRANDPTAGAFEFLKRKGVKEIWLVRAANPPPSAPGSEEYAQWIDGFSRFLEEQGATVVPIPTATGAAAFTVYQLGFSTTSPDVRSRPPDAAVP
ncbi:MAG: glycosyltransferase family 39 protein [Patescibacteria group bacterium]|nr:glycosyltransferase family 39 protein [Patescibacteria group bacterium]